MQESMKKNEPVIKLTTSELVSIFKSILLDRLDIDLEELDVNVIVKYSNNRLHMTLGTDLLRRTNIVQYVQLIQDMKKFFGPAIFTVSTAIDSNILINKLFAGYDYYRINEDITIEIYY